MFVVVFRLVSEVVRRFFRPSLPFLHGLEINRTALAIYTDGCQVGSAGVQCACLLYCQWRAEPVTSLIKGFWGGRVGTCPMVFHDVVEECVCVFNHRVCVPRSRTYPVTKQWSC